MILVTKNSVTDSTGMEKIPRGFICPAELKPSAPSSHFIFDRDARSLVDLSGNGVTLTDASDSAGFGEGYMSLPGNSGGNSLISNLSTTSQAITVISLYYSTASTTANIYALGSDPLARMSHIVNGSTPLEYWIGTDEIQKAMSSANASSGNPRWVARIMATDATGTSLWVPQYDAGPAISAVNEKLSLRSVFILNGIVNGVYNTMRHAESVTFARKLTDAEFVTEYAKLKLRAALRGITLTDA